MKPVYIHSAVSISAQRTFESEVLLSELIEISGKKVEAIHPNYKDYISTMALRRMATGVKMGVATSKKALQEANISNIDAILTGTGMGCIEDTEKFLNAIISSEEEFLTPTSFIQSTHNTVGAQIALELNCNAYNNTYVHGALSFESALIDAQLLIQQDEANTILVGGIDELGTEFVDALRMIEDQTPEGIAVPIGEGASFFILSSEKENQGVELLDMETFSQLKRDSIQEKLNAFLTRNHLKHSEIDVLILGNNGDSFDDYYTELKADFSNEIATIDYKKFCGEFYTASAFGLYLGYTILKSQIIPQDLIRNKISNRPPKTLLLYNQFKGRDHSFILLTLC
ncbi:MAG: beta-ketoacyl synthase chain length factor [Aquaticitalea sp.]